MNSLFSRIEQRGCIVTGTGTDVGKTLCSIQLLRGTMGTYWKPIQTGLDRDRERVMRETGFDEDHFLDEVYRLKEPLSPHEAARRENVTISLSSICIPRDIEHAPLIVEGAGGVMVPLNESEYMVDLFAHLRLPVVVVARSTLGTLNHTLLTLECLRRRDLDVIGVVMMGPSQPENEQAVAVYGNVRVVPFITPE